MNTNKQNKIKPKKQNEIALGIDLGGTKIEAAVVNRQGKILAKDRRPTEAAKGSKQIIDKITKLCRDLQKKYPQIYGLGLGLPGFVSEQGKVLFGGGSLSCLVGTNLKQELTQKCQTRVHLANDANCFALAEAHFGAGKKSSLLLGVIWGTGIGGGIVYNKKIINGNSGAAAEFGHMLLDPHRSLGAVCSCGQRGCWEMLCSGKNIIRHYLAAGGQATNPFPSKLFASREKAARQTIDQALRFMGIGLGNLLNAFNPDMIVLGGGVSNISPFAYKQLKHHIKEVALPATYKNFQLKKYSISDAAGVIGAAALCFD